MEEPLFHLVLEGRKVGPYDRRTVIGMRIRKTLTSEHVLIDTTGKQLTVADLIGRSPPPAQFSPGRTSSFSGVQATYPASLLSVQGRGMAIPAFRGEVEARVQSQVLRLAGRFRKGLGWKDDRVKLPLQDIVHARVDGSEVELGLAAQGHSPQRIRLELFTPALAAAFAGCLPHAGPWPHASSARKSPVRLHANLLWASVGGIAVVLLIVIGLLLGLRY